ncbi:hypothetical protein [Ilyobacter polytropus]|uniref:Uncharacterized protein n=1 Tax=Ilyobacter polytropus (strain ATCC 51220 / DSM 2926 / LMG 16218 / CuHBu1) TaxID=572544 RepID=E3HBN6_ILYPC|nr:hypothetical protein [Ilyobacter polytropus]ADO83732.1 conserved hypothetical protein [Ilyobacter polytropus DSM 2926]
MKKKSDEKLEELKIIAAESLEKALKNQAQADIGKMEIALKILQLKD